MKILFINLPYRGHVVPTIGLVRELLSQGCRVTYLLPFDWQQTVAESGADFHGYKNHKQLAEQIKNAWAAADAIAAEFDLIVYEQFFFLGRHLAEKHHKPAVRIFTAPATNKRLMAEFIAKGPLAVFQNRWIARAFTKDVAKNIPLATDNWLDEILCAPPGLNLVYTLREFQPDEADFPEGLYKFLGPSVYKRAEQGLAFQKGGRPLVYLSLGTVVKKGRGVYTACIEAFRHEDVDVILSAGERFDAKKLKNAPENIRIFPSVPQTAVLQQADVFITHGGMNSISEAMVSATPMVLIPFASDQPANARRAEELGLGRMLEPGAVTAETLKAAVYGVLADETIKQNLAAFGNLIEDAPGNKGGAQAIIQYYREKNGTF